MNDQEALMGVLSQLTANELRKRLQDAGLTSGPITETTRRIFENKLARFMKEKEIGKIKCDPNTTVDASEQAILSEDKDDGRDGDQLTMNISPKVVTEPPTTIGIFFAVCIPTVENECSDHSQVSTHVYKDRSEAMKVLKMNQGARFKVFKTEEEARKFSFSQEISSSTVMHSNTPYQMLSEKSNNFKSPKTIDLVRLMKAIQQNDMASFQELVWSNPRYLISSADTPVIIMGGPRYNALHVAAKHNVADMCRQILNTIENDKFLSMVFVNDIATVREERSAFLLDLYLNTPDKGQCDTPLHFASKFGHIDVLEVLVQHHLCDRGIRNKYGFTPRNVICERCDESKFETLKQSWSRDIPNVEILKSKIESLLDDNFYVPVFRADGNTMQAVIGEPWSPGCGDSSTIHAQFQAGPISPSLQVKAFAGPMSPQKAHDFHSSWKSPIKSRDEMKQIQEIRRRDDEKGLERIGRTLAHTMAVPWSEYWEFLGRFADFSTEEGLTLLENFFKNKSNDKSTDNDDSVGDLTGSLDDKLVRESEDVNEAHIVQAHSVVEANVSIQSDSVVEASVDVQAHYDIHAHGDPRTVDFAVPALVQCSKENTEEKNAQIIVNNELSGKHNDLDDCLIDKFTLLDTSTQKLPIPISRSCQEKFLRRSLHHNRILYRENSAEFEVHNSNQSLAASGHAQCELFNCDLNKDTSIAASNIDNSSLQQEQSSVIKPCQHTANMQGPHQHSLCKSCHPVSDFQDSQAAAVGMDNISTPKRNQTCHSTSFIQGFEPSKLDMNVYLALENVNVPHTYPNIIAFKKLVESYSESVRKSWKTPIRLRRHWPWGQEHESSPLVGGRSDVKAYNISQSFSPNLERRRVISSGSNAHQDIKEKLFTDAT